MAASSAAGSALAPESAGGASDPPPHPRRNTAETRTIDPSQVIRPEPGMMGIELLTASSPQKKELSSNDAMSA
jgi:hypothetical protein